MGQKAILLAEDDPAHAELIRRAFTETRQDCRLEVVRSGTEMIEYLFATGAYAERDSTQMPHLILLDLKMPKMGGLQVLQVLRRVRSDGRPPFPPVVIFTSSSTEVDVTEAYRLGAHSYVQKPVEFQKFVAAVCQIVAYWLELNEPLPTGRAGLPGDAARLAPSIALGEA